MHYGRNRVITALAALALIGSATVASSPAQAEPDIDDVKQRVDNLYHEAEQAQERYHDTKLRLDALREELESLRADQKRQSTEVAEVRDDLRATMLRQYEGSDLSAVGQVVVAEDPQEFMSGLTTMSAVSSVQSALYDAYATQVDALELRRDATERRVAEISEAEQALAEEKAAVDDKLADAEALLDKLEAEEREAMLSRGVVRVPSDVPASGRAAAAVDYALAQVGDAYVYGAAGESAFDCSGLTMRAWGTAGVGLPHSSSAQFGTGTRVSESDLQPGDLVFYYSPISHVGMYIGNGMIVHAANPGAGVRVDSLHSMPYVGAVRPG